MTSVRPAVRLLLMASFAVAGWAPGTAEASERVEAEVYTELQGSSDGTAFVVAVLKSVPAHCGFPIGERQAAVAARRSTRLMPMAQ